MEFLRAHRKMSRISRLKSRERIETMLDRDSQRGTPGISRLKSRERIETFTASTMPMSNGYLPAKKPGAD